MLYRILSRNSSLKYWLAAIAAGGLVTGLPSLTQAQSLPGLTIFSGVDRENLLSYRLDWGGKADGWDRYRLRIPAKKMELGAAQFVISYPNYFRGRFDPKKVEVEVKGKLVPVKQVNWDKENHRLQISMQEPVPANSRVEIILNNVKNPPFGGTYYFNAAILSPGDVPLPRMLGTWILTIN